MRCVSETELKQRLEPECAQLGGGLLHLRRDSLKHCRFSILHNK